MILSATTYLTQNLISDPATVEALDALHVKVLEDHRVAQVLVIAHLFQCQPRINKYSSHGIVHRSK